MDASWQSNSMSLAGIFIYMALSGDKPLICHSLDRWFSLFLCLFLSLNKYSGNQDIMIKKIIHINQWSCMDFGFVAFSECIKTLFQLVGCIIKSYHYSLVTVLCRFFLACRLSHSMISRLTQFILIGLIIWDIMQLFSRSGLEQFLKFLQGRVFPLLFFSLLFWFSWFHRYLFQYSVNVKTTHPTCLQFKWALYITDDLTYFTCSKLALNP